MDETLVHERLQPLSQPADLRFGDNFIYTRPDAADLVRFAATKFSIAVWSSANPDYVEFITSARSGNSAVPSTLLLKKGKLLDIDLETWLLDAGGLVIQKMAEQGESALSGPERAVHCMWLIDYSVRNAGCFGPLEDMGAKTALSDLARLAQDAKLSTLPSWLQLSDNEEAFCSTYHQHFDKACAELKGYCERTSA